MCPTHEEGKIYFPLTLDKSTMAKWRVGQTASAGTPNHNTWFHASHNHFDEVNWTQRKWTIDATHAGATYYRSQTASQFGEGKYSLQLRLQPVDGNILRTGNDPDWVARKLRARFKIHYYPTNFSRREAMRELKHLEDWDNENTVEIDTQQNRRSRHNGRNLKLLASGIDDADVSTPSTPTGVKGQNIIRMGFEESYPKVFRQSTLTTDLNSDGDLNDSYEIQYYYLAGDDSTAFGIFNRMEAHDNPEMNNVRKIDRDWAYPMTLTKSLGWMTRTVELVWSEEGNGFDTVTIPNIDAMGGLIGIEMEFADRGGAGALADTNNYELYAEITCHKWRGLGSEEFIENKEKVNKNGKKSKSKSKYRK